MKKFVLNFLILFIAALIAEYIIVILFDIHLIDFEDGSFMIHGCLPWAICAIGG